MKLSIVIPNWLTKDGGRIEKEAEAFWFLRQCVERIKKYTQNFELILVDNGSTVGSEWMKENADKYVRNDENKGFAVARNQGFALAEGEFVCCMNNDIFVWEGWAEALYKTFEDNANCGIAMPALMKQTKNAKEALTLETIDLTTNYNKYGSHAEFGSCWMIKRDFMEKIAMTDGYIFDENFKIGFGEDRDLWIRVRQHGLETFRTHRTRVFHQGNVTIGKIKDRKQYTYPNREYLKKKHNLE